MTPAKVEKWIKQNKDTIETKKVKREKEKIENDKKELEKINKLFADFDNVKSPTITLTTSKKVVSKEDQLKEIKEKALKQDVNKLEKILSNVDNLGLGTYKGETRSKLLNLLPQGGDEAFIRYLEYINVQNLPKKLTKKVDVVKKGGNTEKQFLFLEA